MSTPGTVPSPRHPLIAFTALILCVSFFLPWFQTSEGSISLWAIVVRRPAQVLPWLIPAFAVAAVFAAWLGRGVTMAACLAGVLPYVYLSTFGGNGLGVLLNSIGSGGWLALLSGLLLFLLAPALSDRLGGDPLKTKRTLVLDHWHALADDFSLSPGEFYQSVEKELAARKVPGLETRRLELHESTVLSARREYLRLCRENIIFDICAAPFGTACFFSYRICLLTPELNYLGLALAVFALFLCWTALSKLGGFLAAIIGLCVLTGLLFTVLKHAGRSLALTLEQSALFGGFYVRFFRPETYHRIDTRLMYLRTIPEVVKTLAIQVTGEGGVKLMREYQLVPSGGLTYRATTVSPSGKVSVKPFPPHDVA